MSEVPLQVVERTVVASVALTARALTEVGQELTFAQWRVLVVADTPGGVPVGHLASSLGANFPAMSRLVRRLQHRGLVETRRDDVDGRRVRVSLSAAGRELRARVVERRRVDLWRAVNRLHLDPDAWATLDLLAAAMEEAARPSADPDPDPDPGP